MGPSQGGSGGMGPAGRRKEKEKEKEKEKRRAPDHRGLGGPQGAECPPGKTSSPTR